MTPWIQVPKQIPKSMLGAALLLGALISLNGMLAMELRGGLVRL